MNNLLKNKFVLIIIIAILLVFAFTCSCFANSFPMSDGSSLEISEFPKDFSSYKHYILLYENPSLYHFILWDDDAIDYFVYDFTDDIKILKFRDAKGTSDFEGDVGIYYYVYNDGFVTKENFSKNTSLNISYYYGKGGYSSNVNLCYDNSTDVVFPRAPQVGVPVEPLTEITQVEEIQPVVVKIVVIVLPVCLGIFGVLLVLYLIKSKNLLQL